MRSAFYVAGRSSPSSGRCARSRSSPNSSTTPRNRPSICSCACGRSTGPGIPKVVHEALIETLHTATLGTILAVAIGEPGGAHGRAQHHALGRPQHHRPLHPGGDPLGARDDLGAVLRRRVRPRRARRHAGDRRAFDRLHRQIPVGSDRGGEARPDRGADRRRRLAARDPDQGLLAAGEARFPRASRCSAGTSTCANPPCSASSAAAGSAWRSIPRCPTSTGIRPVWCWS